MLIKNKSGKIISVGSLNIFPEATEILPTEFQANSVIQALSEQNKIELIEETEQASLAGRTISKSRLKKMKKSELEKLAVDAGLALLEGETVNSLREKLLIHYEVV